VLLVANVGMMEFDFSRLDLCTHVVPHSNVLPTFPVARHVSIRSSDSLVNYSQSIATKQSRALNEFSVVLLLVPRQCLFASDFGITLFTVANWPDHCFRYNYYLLFSEENVVDSFRFGNSISSG